MPSNVGGNGDVTIGGHVKKIPTKGGDYVNFKEKEKEKDKHQSQNRKEH